MSCEILNSAGELVIVDDQLFVDSNNGKSIASINTKGLTPGMYYVKILSGNLVLGVTRFVVN